MKGPVRVRVVPRSSLSLLGCFLLAACLLAGGCRSRPTTSGSSASTDAPVSPVTRLDGKGNRSETRPADRIGAGKTPEQLKFEAEQKKEQEITAQLEQANSMLKGQNLEGALRLVQRVALEHAQDPYVIMRTSYLEAMIFHKMKDAGKRKDAMNRLLKSMEALQGDPRFQQGFLDGMANQEVIKMSLDKAGKKYGP